MSGGVHWDIVHTIDGWYDGPREGAAEFLREPVWYRSVYLDNPDEYRHDEERFELTPLTGEALRWIVERDEIFCRWDSAQKAGAITWEVGDEASFGALNEDMARYRELNRKINAVLSLAKPEYLVRGIFEPRRVRWEKI